MRLPGANGKPQMRQAGAALTHGRCRRRVCGVAGTHGSLKPMRKGRLDMKRLAAMLVLVAGIAVPLLAHHGNAAYDDRTVTVKGTVTQWKWTNPHSFLLFDAKDEKGEVVH